MSLRINDLAPDFTAETTQGKSWWASEAMVNFVRERGEPTRMQSLEWENRFQFTTTGAQPYELGLLLEVQRERESLAGYQFRTDPLLQAHWGAVQANLNLLFERRVRAEASSATEFGYQWQLRAHRDAPLGWGVQGFGHPGRWDRWAPRAALRTSSARC